MTTKPEKDSGVLKSRALLHGLAALFLLGLGAAGHWALQRGEGDAVQVTDLAKSALVEAPSQKTEPSSFEKMRDVFKAPAPMTVEPPPPAGQVLTQEIDPPERDLEEPNVSHGITEYSEHGETADELHGSRGGEDHVTDIPVGGTGTVTALGLGGGSPSGRFGYGGRAAVNDAKRKMARPGGGGAVPVLAPEDGSFARGPRSNAAQARRYGDRPDAESYAPLDEKGFTRAAGYDALSTFAADVDTASYSNVRRFIDSGARPPAEAVRIEELVNYFEYDFAPPEDGQAFAVHCEVNACPWDASHRLALVALKGRTIDRGIAETSPRSNLVFLIDVSGSMGDANKLDLVRRGLHLLVRKLGSRDRVAIVTYAGNAGVALDSTACDQKRRIFECVDGLRASGSTNGSAGIQMAYEIAAKNFIKGGANRVIVCSDGDFNVGVTDNDRLVRLIEQKAASGVFLTVLGFGMGNLKDDKLELLADKGNGHYAYIDRFEEARKVFDDDLEATLVTIAKDVKIQVEFNPAEVFAYRLIGYENRVMGAREFRDDAKDGGEIGAGHRVIALYELIPAGKRGAGPLKYQELPAPKPAAPNGECFTVFLRHKQPDGHAAAEREVVVRDEGKNWADAGANLRWASAVAMFGLQLRESEYKGSTGWDLIENTAESAKGDDLFGRRAEFLALVAKARTLR